MTQRVLISGGTVVSLAPGRPPSEQADILIEDGRIAAIGSGFGAIDAEIVDVSGQIVMPGFVDTHRHLWQTGIRGVAADWSLHEYVRHIRLGYAAAYTAEDVRISMLVGLLEAIDAGITTICDFCHIINSPAHADAALDAFRQSGIRGLLCYGFYDVPLATPAFSSHADRIKDAERLVRAHQAASAGTTQIGIALTETGLASADQTRAEIDFARAHGLRITAHMGTLSTPDAIAGLDRASLLGPDILHVHCNFSSDQELVRVRDSGGSVSCTPETELQMGMGFPVIGRLLALGMRPSLGADIVSDCSGDLFAQMRLGLQVERALRNAPVLAQRRMPATIAPSCIDALRFATVDGATALGLSQSVGCLAPGLAADLITLRTDGLHFMPPAAPIAAIVLQARSSDVHNVMVDGVFRKRDGELVGWNLDQLRQAIRAANSRIVAEVWGRPETPTSEAYAHAIAQMMPTNAARTKPRH